MADDPIPESDLDADDQAKAPDSDKLREVHERAMRRFDSVAVPQAEMRAQSLEDRRFCVVPGAQWEGAFGEQYENAPRPEIDQISKRRDKIDRDFRDNRMMADFVPVGSESDEGTAETLDGIFRADAQHFHSDQAWANAQSEAKDGGFGAWRLTTDYADPYDPDSDAQRVNPGLIITDADQSVYFDPASKLQDHSDAKWVFVRVNEIRAEAEDKWGDGIAPWPLDTWQYQWDWYQPDTVSIAEYYEVEDVSAKLLVFTHKQTEEEQRHFVEDMEPGSAKDLVSAGWEKRTRSVKRKRVHKYIMSGSQVLKDCGYIAGTELPIVPVYGKFGWVDNMIRFEGCVRKAKDPQRMFNAGMARLTETDSRAPYEVPIFNEAQMTPAQADNWARANIDRLPYLTVGPSINEADGSVISAGPVGKVEPPQVAPTTAQILSLTLQVLTGEDDNTDQVQANVSADAMDIAKATIDERSAIYIDNARISHRRGAEIWLGMAKDVYYEEGRKVDTLTHDGQDGEAELGEPVMDAHGVYRVKNDFTQGKFKVVSDVQEATVSRRAKTVKEGLNIMAVLTPLVGSNPQAATLALGAATMVIGNMDGEGIADFQDLAHKVALQIGSAKPTKEEAQEMAEAAQQAQQGQQPDPQSQALISAAANQQSQADLNQAKKLQVLADAHLKDAQAAAVGGPEQAPKPPTGLSPANDVAQVADTAASARLKDAQAAKIVHDIHGQRIKSNHEQDMDRARLALEQRQQDHVESQPHQSAA